MNNDRIISISHGNNRRSTNWQPQTLLLSELWEKLRIPTRGTETLADYMSMKRHSRMTSRTLAAMYAER